MIRGARAGAVGVLTGWGPGVAALPPDAARAAGPRTVVPLAAPAVEGERFRRATRECLLAVAAVSAALEAAGLPPERIAGPRTALVFVTAAAYLAANLAHVDAGGSGRALQFPYTAPSAVPGEVAIAFGVRGPYQVLIGGATAGLDALWQAGRLVDVGVADRALVLGVETFAECEPLYANRRWSCQMPLVEAAACVLLERGGAPPRYVTAEPVSELEALTGARAGETLGCAPLIALGLAREAGSRTIRLTGEWLGSRRGLEIAG
jgi:3-oxoacyl-[acyl-carrier-protein] synthase II